MNKKTRFLLFLFLVIAFGTLVGYIVEERRTLYFYGTKDGNSLIHIKVDSFEEEIEPYFSEEENKNCFFLPAFCADKCIFGNSKDHISIDGKKVDLFTGFKYDNAKNYDLVINAKNENVMIFCDTKLPTVFISTDSGNMEYADSSKANSEDGKICIIDEEGSLAYMGKMQIHARGNSTFESFEKKAYNIELKDEAKLLGMESSKNWCMLANSWDYSFMNNKLAFDMAKKSGLAYTPDSEYANVYLNGKYWGLYLIAEKIEVGKNRINISDLGEQNRIANPDKNISEAEKFDYGDRKGVLLDNIPSDITGGYLLERDYRLNPEYHDRKLSDNYFETKDAHTSIHIKTPKYASIEEVEYIRDLTSDMEEAFMSGEGYSQKGKYYLDYIDLYSWVKWYMVAEIAYDLDKDVTNTYIYKDKDSVDTRFYLGPVWDFDCRFGGTDCYASPYVLTKLEQGGGWIRFLYDRPEFSNEISGEWKDFFEPYLREEAPSKIAEWKYEIDDSVRMDNVRWNRNEGYPKNWPNIYSTEEFTNDYNFDDQVDYLQDWLDKRREFLDSCWK